MTPLPAGHLSGTLRATATQAQVGARKGTANANSKRKGRPVGALVIDGLVAAAT
jgi:hypothetical protein